MKADASGPVGSEDEVEGGYYDVLNPDSKEFIENTFTSDEHAMLMDLSPFAAPVQPEQIRHWNGEEWVPGFDPNTTDQE